MRQNPLLFVANAPAVTGICSYSACFCWPFPPAI